ncbi:MAG: tonB-system energizer ExbB, partial [Mesorhizobium sp.]
MKRGLALSRNSLFVVLAAFAILAAGSFLPDVALAQEQPAPAAQPPATEAPTAAAPTEPRVQPAPGTAGGEETSAIALTLPHDLSPWGMFMNADIVVKAVMVGLALASLVTWTIWLAKSL